jgi:ribonuclease I
MRTTVHHETDCAKRNNQLSSRDKEWWKTKKTLKVPRFKLHIHGLWPKKKIKIYKAVLKDIISASTGHYVSPCSC